MIALRTIVVVFALSLAIPASAQVKGPAVKAALSLENGILVPAGSIVELVTSNTISSKKNVKGDLLYLKVVTPVIVDGVTAIPVGTVVVGQLKHAEQRGAFGKSGKLEIELLYAELLGGTLRISGTLEARGKRGADDSAATAIAFLAMPFVATGRSAEIPGGTQVNGRLDRDLRINRR